MRFITVGMIGAVVDFGVANTLMQLLAMPLVVAGTISFCCAVISNFIWNRHWTYPESRSRHVAHQLGMFALVSLAGVTIRLPILRFLEPVMIRFFGSAISLAFLSPEFAARNATLAVAVGVVMLWNFFVNRYWTFNDVG